jgi:hypothetical protein
MPRSPVLFLRDVEPELIGRAVAPGKRIRQLDRRSQLVGRQGAVNMAVGALNNALWDALRESEQRFRDYSETASDWLRETGPPVHPPQCCWRHALKPDWHGSLGWCSVSQVAIAHHRVWSWRRLYPRSLVIGSNCGR